MRARVDNPVHQREYGHAAQNRTGIIYTELARLKSFKFTVEDEEDLLMLKPVTGSERGRLYSTSWRALHATVTPLTNHPNFPRFQRPLDGRYCGARPRNMSSAVGMAKVSC